jgi:hypothetical protein
MSGGEAGSLNTPVYDLFISYYRRDMRMKIGRCTVDLIALFKAELERHQRPKALKCPGRFRVCTDIDDFELGETFDAVMSARIRQSRKFMLVCSPNCAASPFVRQEVRLFGRLKAGEKPLAATFRNNRRWLVGAAIVAAVVIGGLVVGLSGNLGFHVAVELPAPRTLVAPAGTGFAVDGRTPIVFRDRAAYLWESIGRGVAPAVAALPVDALYAVHRSPAACSSRTSTRSSFST